MPTPQLADAEAALAATIEPLRNLMAAIEAEITEREAELVTLRKRRTETGRALTSLDPRWSAERKKAKPRKPSNIGGQARISQARLDRVVAEMQAFNGQAFNAGDISERTDLHITTVHKVLKHLHDQGRIQLDHLGGLRSTTRYYTLLPTPEGGTDGN